jgi:hypothetical protein
MTEVSASLNIIYIYLQSSLLFLINLQEFVQLLVPSHPSHQGNLTGLCAITRYVLSWSSLCSAVTGKGFLLLSMNQSSWFYRGGNKSFNSRNKRLSGDDISSKWNSWVLINCDPHHWGAHQLQTSWMESPVVNTDKSHMLSLLFIER